MPERLVFVSRRIPYPLTNGSRVRTYRLLAGLSQVFETTLVVYEHAPDASDGGCSARELAELLPDADIVALPFADRTKRAAQARTLLSTHSWTFGRYRTEGLRDALGAVVQRRRPDVVHFDDPGVGQFGPVPGTLSVLATHNIEYRIVQGTARADSGARRVFAAVDWRKLKREEERLWRRMPLCLAVSPVDAEILRTAGAGRVELCPNGTDAVAQLPTARRRADEPLRLLFVGSAGYDPYERGLAWFIRDVLPRVQAHLPSLFDVVGYPPTRPIRAAGVSYRGPVPSVRPWYERAHAVIVPVFEGSGTRLKIIEAMAHGRAVVSTRVGAEGLPVEGGRHYLQADNADRFAAALLDIGRRLAQSDPQLEQMIDEARAAVSDLTWDKIVNRLAALYRTASAGEGRP